MQTEALLTNSSFILFPQHDPSTHKHLFHNLALGCVGKYSWVARILAPFFPTPTSSDTNSFLIALHPKSNRYFSFFWSKITSQTRTLSFLLFFSNWHFNACHIYLRWFLNTFETIFTLKIQRMDSFNYSNFSFISHRVTFHPKLHASLERLAS